MARPLPRPLLQSRHAHTIAVAAMIAIVQKQRDQLTRGPREAFNAHIQALAKSRDMLDHLGEETGKLPEVLPPPDKIRDDVREEGERRRAAINAHKQKLYEHMKQVQKAETQIWRLQEEEADELKQIADLLGESLGHLENPFVSSSSGGALTLSSDATDFKNKIGQVRTFFTDELLAKLVDRQEKLLRFVENTEQMLANQYAAAFTTEELSKLSEIHDKVTMRSRGFANRRSRAYKGFGKALDKMVQPLIDTPVTELSGSSSADLIKNATICCTRMKKAVEILREDTMTTGRMFRLEKRELEELTEKFKPD